MNVGRTSSVSSQPSGGISTSNDQSIRGRITSCWNSIKALFVSEARGTNLKDKVSAYRSNVTNAISKIFQACFGAQKKEDQQKTEGISIPNALWGELWVKRKNLGEGEGLLKIGPIEYRNWGAIDSLEGDLIGEWYLPDDDQPRPLTMEILKQLERIYKS